MGYVIQDVVADAMTVEAVPTVRRQRCAHTTTTPFKLMHTTMQTLGRMAIVGGGIAVSIVNILMFTGVETMPEEVESAASTPAFYQMALVIPVISVFGVILAELLKRIRARQVSGTGLSGTCG